VLRLLVAAAATLALGTPALAVASRDAGGADHASALTAIPDELDPSFGQGGYVRVQTNESCKRVCVEFGGSYAEALALQPDGGILLGGRNENSAPSLAPTPGALVGLSPNGTLDSSFGVGGIVDAPFDVERLAADIHGGMVALGTRGGPIGVARYTAGGVLDGSFAPTGVRWLPRIGQREDEAKAWRDAQGRIVVLENVSRFNIDVLRFLPSGKLDRSFGHGGHVRLHVPHTRREHLAPVGTLSPLEVGRMGIVTEPDGSVIVGFATAQITGNDSLPEQSQTFLEGLTPTGAVDRAFGRDGIVHLGGRGGLMAVAPNRHILLAHVEEEEERQEAARPNRTSRRTGRREGGSPSELLLTDYSSAGRLDRSFGSGGIAHMKLPRFGFDRAAVNAIAFDATGDAILVGEDHLHTIDVPMGVAFIARYTPHGRDCTFGRGGLLYDQRFGGFNAVAVQPNGRIVAVGWSDKAFLAARYMGGGQPRTCSGEPHNSAWPERH
jgi:uncharacterized delta-60 repeat protein